MRALHLIGLRAPGGKKLRYPSEDDEPLFLPSWIPASDREVVIDCYQAILAEETLPRVEIDWYRSLGPTDRGYLQRLRARHSSRDHLLVIRVLRDGVAMEDMLSQDEIRAFRYVAITSDFFVEGERYGGLGRLAAFVGTVVEELYDELSGELGLRSDGSALLEPFVRTLLNPVLVVEATNALIDVQAEKVPLEDQRDTVIRRLLRRLLDALSNHEAVALAAIAAKGMAGCEQAMGNDEREAAFRGLRRRQLLLDERLIRWAQWLYQEPSREIVANRLRAAFEPSASPPIGAAEVLGWLDDGARRSMTNIELADRISKAMTWAHEGALDRARDELDVLASEIEISSVPPEVKDHYDLVTSVLDLATAVREAAGSTRQSSS